jgi:UDP-N-acetyl-D-glucosamine dehydrogenase
MDSVADLMAEVAAADCVLVITDHSSYDYQAIHDAAQMVFDSRNSMGQLAYDHRKVEML